MSDASPMTLKIPVAGPSRGDVEQWLAGFTASGLAQCRSNSKYLALQIATTELGLLGPL